MKTIVEILRAMGEETRFRILSLLAYGELSAGELAIVLNQSQPRVSRHLKLLTEANIIERRPEGAWVFLRLSSQEPISNIIKSIINAANVDDFNLTRDKARLEEIKSQRAENAKAYFEKISNEWESLRKLHQPEQEVTKAILDLTKGMKFDFHLDLGSGLGDILQAFANNTKQGEGIDSSRGMITLARARFDDRNDNHLNVRLGDIYSLPYKDEFADLITIHQVLHYLDDPTAVIVEAARVLTPEGKLIIADFATHEYEELREKFGHRRLGFNKTDIVNFLKSANLVLESFQTIDAKNQQNGLKINIFLASKNKKK